MAKIVQTEIREGRTIDIYDSGMERDRERGRLVKPPNNTLITPEKSQLMHQSRREKAIEGHILGTIDGAGIEIPPDASPEEITLAYGNSIRAVVAHHVETFMKSGNLRGMGESLTKILAPVSLDSNPEDWQRKAEADRAAYTDGLSLLVRELKKSIENKPEVIEGKTL